MAKLQKASTNFTQVSNRVLVDSHLSWKAKGLYANLFSKPDNWNFSADRIKNEGSDGRDAILSGLRELETLGYISRKKLGNGSMIYYIGIEPITENPTLDIDPKSENPTVGKSHSGKTRLISNIVYTNNTVLGTSNTELTEFSEAFVKVFTEYSDMRKQKRSSLTPISSSRILKKSKEYGELRAIEVLNVSIDNGWLWLGWDKKEKSSAKKEKLACETNRENPTF